MKSLIVVDSEFILDDDVFEVVSKLSVFRARHKNGGRFGFYLYYKDQKTKKSSAVHRLIMKAPKGMVVDHINMNTLDNRRENLRVIEHGKNVFAAPRKVGKTGFRGVWPSHGKRKGFVAFIRHHYKRYYLGTFDTAEAAFEARQKKALELFGEVPLEKKK